MSGNHHVRFYGEGVGLTRPPYPRCWRDLDGQSFVKQWGADSSSTETEAPNGSKRFIPFKKLRVQRSHDPLPLNFHADPDLANRNVISTPRLLCSWLAAERQLEARRLVVEAGFEPANCSAELIYSQRPLATWILHQTKRTVNVWGRPELCQEVFCPNRNCLHRLPSDQSWRM
jgi:hypothetical protein